MPRSRGPLARREPYLDRALEMADDERGAGSRPARRGPGWRRGRGAARRATRSQPEGSSRRAPRPPARVARRPDVGAYTLIEPIGQGGMGSVWLARRERRPLRGRAAVKLLNASLVGRAGEKRFRARGHHPRAADASAHRAPDRRRRLADRPALSRARARRRRADRPLLRRHGARTSRRACACSSTCSRPSRTRTPT